MTARLLSFFYILIFCSIFWTKNSDAVEPQILRIDPHIQAGRLKINADIAFDLNEELENVVRRGVPLYFTADLILTRTRWWWLQSTEVETSTTWSMVYNLLTRQWRVGPREFSLPVSSLEEAMNSIRHIQNWDVCPIENLSEDTLYHGRLRVRLDVSLLSRPLQINALNSQSWTVATPWIDFEWEMPKSKSSF